jgi:hypothetical protein
MDGRTDGHKHEEINMTKIRCALFWDIAQRKMAIPYRRFRKTYRFHLQRPRNQSLLGLLDHYLLRNISEEYRSHLNRCRSPKSLLICGNFATFRCKFTKKIYAQLQPIFLKTAKTLRDVAI